MAAMDEAVLLSLYAREQDADAFRALVEAHQDMVFATCRRLLGSRADAEDATQECFFRLARKAHELKAPIAGWLHRVAVQGAVDILRRRRTRTAREAAAARREVQSGEPTWEDVRDRVDEAIAALPERLRVTLVLYYLEGRTQEDVAHRLGVSQPAVSQRLKEGVTRLRERLKQAGVVVSAAAIEPMLLANALEAAPATLTAALGKMALAGVHGAAAAAGTPLLAKGTIALAALLAAIVAGVWLVSRAAPQPAEEPPALLVRREPERSVAAPVPEPSASMASAAGTLSGVIERVLGADDAGADMFIDLDTGKLYALPLDVAEVESMLAWMRDKGVDAFYSKGMQPRGLIVADAFVVHAPSSAWDRPDGVGRLLQDVPPQRNAFPVYLDAGAGLPATFIYRTREGGAGVLQIVAFDQPGASVRLKPCPPQHP